MLTSLSFSPDGKDIYFTRGTPKRGKFQLCRIPSGGGLVTPILDDVDSAISFSPDRRKFVFMRGADLETQIVVSAADGSWQYPLTKQTFPHWFSFAAPDWSPDGKSVAAGLVDESKGLRSSIVLIPVDTPENGREIYSSTGYFGRLRWLPDMSGLLTIVLEDVSPEGAESQFSRMSGGSLWRIRYPDGRAEPLMPDLADYDLYTLDISTDGSVATVMNSLVSDLWIASADHLDAAERITKDHPVVARHAWLPDNDTMIYRDMRGNLNAVTKDRREFRLALPAGQRVVGGVSACGVSGEVVFQAAPGNNIWRVTPTAGNPARLTGGLIDKNPACSPDGQSVWYASLGTEPSSLKQIPIEGGRPTATIPGEAFEALVSPKGKMIYYWAWAWEDQPVRTRLGRWNVIGARDQTLHFNVPANATDGIPPAWAPDESGLDYIVTQNGVSNIWRLPLGGGPPVPVTRLSANQIFSFAWSPDGRWLSFASGFNRSDVVVLSRRP
jgi:Tol biopolymer transport system component